MLNQKTQAKFIHYYLLMSLALQRHASPECMDVIANNAASGGFHGHKGNMLAICTCLHCPLTRRHTPAKHHTNFIDCRPHT